MKKRISRKGKAIKLKIYTLILLLFILYGCGDHSSSKNRIATTKNYFTALDQSSSSKLYSVIGDSLLTKIPEYDYQVKYSKKDYVEKWLKWDSVFDPTYKVLALNVANENVVATVSKTDKRIAFFMHKPFLTQETFKFKNGKIAEIETKYLNFNEKTWGKNRKQLLNWVATNHPEYEGFINDQTEAGGIKFLEILNRYQNKDKRYLFFLHNRFLEEHELNELHPEHGRTEYKEILAAFEKSGLTVISELRNANVNAREYAGSVVNQIDSLMQTGVEPQHITVVGTSKGGYIAQYVSTLANNPDLNFVFVASFRDEDLQNIPEINFCGNILTIYEKTDPFGVSAIQRKESSTCTIRHFKEIELNTGLGHGFLFKPLSEWVQPTIQWANAQYSL